MSIGSFCAPASESLKQKLYEDIEVTERYAFFKQINSIMICGLIALGLAMLYVVAVQFFPKAMNYLSVLLGLIFLCLMLLFLVFYPTGSVGFKIAFALIMLCLLVIVGLGAFKSRACFNMHGVFLSHATNLLKQNYKILIFVPIFLAIFTLFIVMIVWELKSLWSSAPLTFD